MWNVTSARGVYMAAGVNGVPFVPIQSALLYLFLYFNITFLLFIYLSTITPTPALSIDFQF
jgi:hypothetical protein